MAENIKKSRIPLLGWGASFVGVFRFYPPAMRIAMYLAAVVLTLPVVSLTAAVALRTRNRYRPLEHRTTVAHTLWIGMRLGFRGVWWPVLGRKFPDG